MMLKIWTCARPQAPAWGRLALTASPLAAFVPTTPLQVAMEIKPVKTDRRGLTLMEVVISSFLVGTVLITSLSTTASWRRYNQQNREREITRRLAEELVSEITSTGFMNPNSTTPGALGREAGELSTSRANWNDVDDYHGMAETIVRDKSGVGVADATGYVRAVTIKAASPIVSAPGYLVNENLASPLRSVIVTVTSPTRQTVVARGLKSNIDTAFPSALSHLRSIAIELSDSGVTTARSVGVSNHPEVTP